MAYNYGNVPMNGYGYPYSTGNMGYSQSYNAQPQPQTNYQQMPQQPQMSYQAPTQNQSIIWVQGEAGAKAYPVAAGQSVLLMDSEDAVLYVKSTDQTGRPLPMESYDLVKRESVVNMPQISQKSHGQEKEYVTMSDLEGKINDMVTKAVSKALGE